MRARQVNVIIARLDDSGKYVRFLDVGQSFLDAEGNVKKGILQDNLHLTPQGYEVWSETMQPVLDEMVKAD